MSGDDDLYEMAEELDEAAKLCNDECGEWWSMLAAMWPRVRDGASGEFQAAYEKELRSEHKRFKDEFRIVEEIETREVKHRTVHHESEW